MLRTAGFRMVHAPLMKFAWEGIAGALTPTNFPELTVFTSPRGVPALQRRLSAAAKRRVKLEQPPAAAAGPATARLARAAGWRVIAGDRANGGAELLAELRQYGLHPRRIWLVCPEADSPLERGLRKLKGATVRRIVGYRSMRDPAGLKKLRNLQGRPIAAVLCGSPKQWAAFRSIWRGTHPPVIVPGQTTAAAVRACGATALIARNFTAPELRKALRTLTRISRSP